MEKPMVNHRFWLPICTKKRMVQVWRVAWLTADWSSAATKVGTSRVPSCRREKKRLQPPVIRVPQEPGETWGKTEPTSKHHQTYGFHESSGSLESPFAQLFAHWPWGMRSPGGEPIGNGRWPDAHKMLLDLRLKTAASTCCSSQLLRCTDAGWCGKGGIYIYTRIGVPDYQTQMVKLSIKILTFHHGIVKTQPDFHGSTTPIPASDLKVGGSLSPWKCVYNFIDIQKWYRSEILKFDILEIYIYI